MLTMLIEYAIHCPNGMSIVSMSVPSKIARNVNHKFFTHDLANSKTETEIFEETLVLSRK